MKTIMNILEEEKQNFPLTYYIRYNELDKVLELLKSGSDANEKSEDFRNPLALAFTLKNLDCAQMLLEYGANPNLLCGSEPIGFLAPKVVNIAAEQENAWIYTKKAYDLLNKFETDFTVKHSMTNETLEEYFSSCLPSIKFQKEFK